MIEERVRECLNCGGTSFVEVTSFQRRCEYCGTVIDSPEKSPELLECPRCGFENEYNSRYCNQCALALSRWAEPPKRKTDLAIYSILATVVGSFLLPVGGAILGLFLGYKARDLARATGGKSGSKDLARIAIVVGWVWIGFSFLPLCFLPLIFGGEFGISLCSGFF